MKYCHKCSTEWNGVNQPGTRDACAKCSADLHVCLNCRFYNTHKPYDCECDIDAPVYRKESANYCEEFEFRDVRAKTDAGDAEKKARAQWDKLFGK